MTTYNVIINAAKSEYTDIYAAVKAIANAIEEDWENSVSLVTSDNRGEVWNSNSDTKQDLRYFFLSELADIYGLNVRETVEGGNNGYPRGFAYVLTGFESWEQAEKISAENGLSLVWLDQRDGWKTPERSSSAYEPISLDAESLGYECEHTETAEEYFEDEKEMLAECSSLAEAREKLDEIEEVCDLLDKREEDEIVLTSAYQSPEIVKKEVIGYSYDTHNYSLGAEVVCL